MKLQYSGNTYAIYHSYRGFEIGNMEIDPDFISLIISIKNVSSNGGNLEITLPRELIDAKRNGNDDLFIVLIDGEEEEHKEIGITSHDRTLQIPIPAGAKEIEIVGTRIAGQEYEILPEIIFDKEVYNTTDKMVISIISPMSNKNPHLKDRIRVTLISHDVIAGSYEFEETGNNTGIFEEIITLTPDDNLFKGDLFVVPGQSIGVEFTLKEGLVARKYVRVKADWES